MFLDERKSGAVSPKSAPGSRKPGQGTGAAWPQVHMMTIATFTAKTKPQIVTIIYHILASKVRKSQFSIDTHMGELETTFILQEFLDC